MCIALRYSSVCSQFVRATRMDDIALEAVLTLTVYRNNLLYHC